MRYIKIILGHFGFITKNQGGRLVNREKIVVIDFGGQYNQLVARRVRECNVYCRFILTRLISKRSKK